MSIIHWARCVLHLDADAWLKCTNTVCVEFLAEQGLFSVLEKPAHAFLQASCVSSMQKWDNYLQK